jgi:Zn ribbon nucleic-acid-binding protein
MKHIDRTVEDVIGAHEQYETDKEGQSRRRAYEQSIEAVHDTAGKTEAKRLARWSEDRIRDEKELPSGRQVRKKGAEIVRDAGHQVSTNDWLGA